jgi:hypothetical protein
LALKNIVKMEIERIHPHEVMADFVNRYEKKIKPALEKGDIGEVKEMQIYLSIADNIMYHNIKSINPKAVLGTFIGIQLDMNSLAKTKSRGELFEELSASLERRATYIDFILNNDPHYKRFRRNN